MYILKKKTGKILKLAVVLLLIAALLCSCGSPGNTGADNGNQANANAAENSVNTGNEADNDANSSANSNEAGNTADTNSADNTADSNTAGNTADTNSADNTADSNTAENTADTNSADNTANTVPAPDNTANNTNNAEPEKSWAEETLESLTLDEKIGQMFMIRPDQLQTSWDTWKQHSVDEGVEDFTEEMQANLQLYPVGGYILFDKHFVDPDQAKAFTAQMYEFSKIVPFVGTDEEGGTKVSRIANAAWKGFEVPQVDGMGYIGETGETELAFMAGDTIAKYLVDYGINLDFAPIADLDDIDSEGVIGDRSFGSDPQLTSKMISAFIDGLHGGNILSCLKHFPGQGSAEIDTHAAYSEIEKTWEEMLLDDIVPFAENKEKADMIMLSHISYPNVTGNELPTSLSSVLITDKLRNEIGYEGIIITDSFHMGAIINTYTSEDAAVTAIKAGADIVLMPDDLVKAFNAVKYAVESGDISEERINESVLRILNLKDKLR